MVFCYHANEPKVRGEVFIGIVFKVDYTQNITILSTVSFAFVEEKRSCFAVMPLLPNENLRRTLKTKDSDDKTDCDFGGL